MKQTLLIFALIVMGWLNVSAESMNMCATFRDGSTSVVELPVSSDNSLTAVYGYVKSSDSLYLIIYQGTCVFDTDWNLSSETTDENARILFKEPVTEIEGLRFETSSGVKAIGDVVDVIVKYSDNTVFFTNVKKPMNLYVWGLDGGSEGEVIIDGDSSVDLSSLRKGIHLLVVKDNNNKNVFSSKIIVK